MAVKSKRRLANYISNWIKERAEAAGAKSLVVGISGGVDSALVAALCARTGLPTYGVMMPCNSSPSSLVRGSEVIKKFKLFNSCVNLADAFNSIKDQVSQDLDLDDSNATVGALRSCLRAPTLDYVGKLVNGVIVGTGNRDEDEVTRYFQKRGDGCVDMSPIAKLHKSEVYELAKYLGVPKSVLEATPSADLWGPDAGQEDEKELGLTYKEVEWGIRTAESPHGLVTFDRLIDAIKLEKDPRKMEVLFILAKMEKQSRHKANPNLPVCNPRDAEMDRITSAAYPLSSGIRLKKLVD